MASFSSRLTRAGFAVALLQVGAVGAKTDPVPPSSPPVAVAPAAGAEAHARGLDAEQVFAVLAGEIAGRRGDMATAFAYYLKAAELTRSARMAELAVGAAVSGGDDASAERGVRLWLTLAPDAAAAHQVAAFLRIKAGDQDGALIHLERLVEQSSGVAESAYAQAIAIIARAPDPRTRVALMEALIDRFPESADAEQSLAMVAASASEFERAETAARRAIELRSDWVTPRLFLVKLLLSEGKKPQARALLEEYVAHSPGERALGMLYGQFLVEEQDFAHARKVFERLSLAQPKDPDLLFALGVLSLQLDDPTAAETYFTRLYATGERQSDAAFYLGRVAERARDVAAALDWYGKVSGANYADAQVRVALLLAKRGEVARAREILQRLRGQSPEDAVALYMLEAEILNDVGRADEAMGVYGAALDAFPDDDNVRYARALYAVKRGQLQLAEDDLRRIIAANPKHADALNALGYTLADRTSRYEEARAYIERAYALAPNEPAILDSMGWISFRLGHYEVAREFLQRALDKLDDGEIAAHLGEVLWAMDRRADAWSVWDAALKAHPGHEYLQGVVGRYRISKSDPGTGPRTQRSDVK